MVRINIYVYEEMRDKKKEQTSEKDEKKVKQLTPFSYHLTVC